jgi:hypothetical protein
MFPIMGLTLGWPATRPIQRPRLPQNAILHWERYSREGEDEALLAYDRVAPREVLRERGFELK